MRAVKEIMATDLKWVEPGATVRSAAVVMSQQRIGCILVGGDGGPPAIVTETDILRRVVAADRNPCSMLVHEIMNQPLVTINQSRPIEEAGDLMAEHGIRHVAVTRRGKVIGLVSVRDLLSRVEFIDVSVERMMSRSPIIAAIDETVRNGAALIAQTSLSAVLVYGQRMRGRPIHFRGLARRDIAGILTGTDVVQEVVARDRDPDVTTVGEVMSALLHTMDGREPVTAAFKLMAQEGLRHVAVTADEEIMGLLSVEDVFEPAWLHVAASPLRQGRS